MTAYLVEQQGPAEHSGPCCEETRPTSSSQVHEPSTLAASPNGNRPSPEVTDKSSGAIYRELLQYLGSPFLSSLQSSLRELGISVSPSCGHLSYLDSIGSSSSRCAAGACSDTAVPAVIADLLRRIDLLLCVRHGETPGNQLGVFQGRSDEQELNFLSAMGRTQAAEAADTLLLRLEKKEEEAQEEEKEAGVVGEESSESCRMEDVKDGIMYGGKRLFVFSSPSSRAYDTAAAFITQLSERARRPPPPPSCPSDGPNRACPSDGPNRAFPKAATAPAKQEEEGEGAYARRWVKCLPSLLECSFGVLENCCSRNASLVTKYYDNYKQMYYNHNTLAKPIGPFLEEHAQSEDSPCECFCEVVLRGFEALKEISEYVDKSLPHQSNEGGKKVVVVVFSHSLLGHALRILLRKPIPGHPGAPMASAALAPPPPPTPVDCEGERCGCTDVMRFSGHFKLPNAFPLELWRRLPPDCKAGRNGIGGVGN
eukprot:GHVS01046460.1.p1 GENE.GHVS01046460.1~~GHVS01046460.1.p1  ORF type:complete len:482 (+),score=127.33 GHVS01046460.1:121-1566(+)